MSLLSFFEYTSMRLHSCIAPKTIPTPNRPMPDRSLKRLDQPNFKHLASVGASIPIPLSPNAKVLICE